MSYYFITYVQMQHHPEAYYIYRMVLKNMQEQLYSTV